MRTLHVYSNRHIKDQVVNIKKGDWIYLENRLSEKRWSLYFNYNNINEKKLKLTYITQDEFFALNTENGMKITFDAICINPPYQDNSIEGNQNKIYNQVCKKAIELLSPTGVLTAITPTAVARPSKRFSLTASPNVVSIDFTADDYFNVGVNICKWVIDKTYSGDISVISANGETSSPQGLPIYDPSKTDLEFAKLYEKLRTITLQERMFYQNNFGPAFSNTKSNKHIYNMHKLESDSKTQISCFSNREPYLKGLSKLVISRSKSFSENAIIISKKDFTVGHMFIDADTKQIKNIKSFIFSEYFIQLTHNWKSLSGTGFNDALIYTPMFNKDKLWTNKEVEDFFNEFRNI